ncbi:hypothetical protein [uncultured Methylobacterium sp.]|jgi:hypothetical protein|uniref:hypothetical protein n=1 Tax=uncultured Methylobacterium sp. TaxID=157278 RepID=UPI00262F52ED|nr:hypothetical protein [uncultured Methylobacterium sp.]
MEGFDGEGRRVVKAGRSIEFDLKQVHLNKLEIARAHRNKLYGRLMLRNAYSLALALRFEKLALTAIDYGSYVWAQAGFYPTLRAWQATANGRLRDAMLGYIEQLPEKDVDWQRKADIYEVVQSDDPRAIWAIAGLHGTVDSRLEPGERVKLGWALLVESGATWEGELPFKADRIAERRLLAYPRKLTKAAAS